MSKRFVIAAIFLLSVCSASAQNLMPVRIGGHWGFMNDSGRLVHHAIYDAFFPVTNYQGKTYYVRKDHDMYLVYGNYKPLLVTGWQDEQYSNISIVNNIIIRRDNAISELYRLNGSLIFSDSFDMVQVIDSTLFLVGKDHKEFLVNQYKKPLLPERYDAITIRNNLICAVGGDTASVFSRSGNVLSRAFDSRWVLHMESDSNFLLLAKFPEYLLISHSDAAEVQYVFVFQSKLNNSFTLFRDSADYQYLFHHPSGTGRWFSPSATVDYLPCNNKITVADNGKVLLFDTLTNPVDSVPYITLRCAGDMIISTDINGLSGLIDLSMQEIIRPKYSYISNFSHGVATYTDTGYTLFGALNKNGKQLLEAEYKRIDIDSALLIAYGKKGARTYYELDANNNIANATTFNKVGTLNASNLNSDINFGISSASGIANCDDCNWFTAPGSGLIGLRHNDNKVAIPAQFTGKKRIGRTRFYLVWVGAKSFAPLNNKLIEQGYTYGIVDYNLKRQILPSMYHYIDTAAIARKSSLSNIRLYSASRGHQLYQRRRSRYLPYQYVASLSNGNYMALEKGRISVSDKNVYEQSYGNYIDYCRHITMISNILFDVLNNNRIAYVSFTNAVWIMLDSMGNPLHKPHHVFSYARHEKKGALVLLDTSGYGIMRINGNWALQPVYSYISDRKCITCDSVYEVRSSSAHCGALDKQGNVIISPFFKLLNPLDENGYTTGIKDGQWVVAKAGNEFIPFSCVARKAGAFSNELAAVKVRSKWGYVNYKGELEIPARYQSAKAFSNGIALVRSDNKYIYINTAGEQLYGRSFAEANSFKGGYALVKTKDRQNRMRLINEQGVQQKGRFREFQTVKHFDMVLAKKGGRVRVFSNYYQNHEWLKKPVYNKYSSHMLLHSKKQGWLIFDRQGHLTGTAKFQKIKAFDYCRAVASNTLGQDYVIDETGNIIYGPVNERIMQVFDTFMVVKQGKYMHIRSFNGRVISFKKARNIRIESYNNITRIRVGGQSYTGNDFGIFREDPRSQYQDLDEDITAVKKNNQVVLLDSAGFRQNQRTYLKVQPFQNGAGIFTVGYTAGLFSTKSGWILECMYDNIEFDHNAVYRYEKDNTFGYIDIMRGRIIWEQVSP